MREDQSARAPGTQSSSAPQTHQAPAPGDAPPWKRIFLFFGLVVVVSHGMGAFFRLLGSSFDDASWVLFAQLGALTPALVALVLVRFAWRLPLASTLALAPNWNRWTLAAWLLPWLLSILALAVGLCMPGASWDGSLQPAIEARLLSPQQVETLAGLAASVGVPLFLMIIPLSLFSGLTLSLMAGLGEEIGWRGFLFGSLQPLGFWRAALITNLFWIAWHLPLIAQGYGYPEYPLAGAFLMVANLMLLGFIGAIIRQKSGSSTVAALFLANVKATSLLTISFIAGGNELTVGIGSLAYILADAAILLILLLFSPPSR